MEYCELTCNISQLWKLSGAGVSKVSLAES
jgi:hypothetical protein